ncbi:MAG: DUF2630 family protein [Candidatus Eremiobacteraeota bacterium]|nr:DUF2630 family protein [Candidatus Eremiobacteraeota bacterium]MBC5802790.1 DUF2630 family protein [Candidatus Eremiobacteraeota bacterium]MBC5820547.1 DUF2630 family protein [Candidatus Eremiobacteraeota bacterium]
MNSTDIQRHIEELVAEEHRLLDAGGAGKSDEAAQRRLDEVNVELDRYYDLLRQRRARDEFAQDTESAHLRSADTVEKYLQ